MTASLAHVRGTQRFQKGMSYLQISGVTAKKLFATNIWHVGIVYPLI